jgi:hypothetical protein
MNNRTLSHASLALFIALAGCSSSSTPDTNVDSGSHTDSGKKTPDSGKNTPDSGKTTSDSGKKTPDSGATPDSGNTPDSGSIADAAKDVAAVDAAACQQACATNNMTGYESFIVDVSEACGCAMGAPCLSDCTVQCTGSTADAGTACAVCVTGQINMGESSSCLVTAATPCLGTGDAGGAGCGAFVKCAEACK